MLRTIRFGILNLFIVVSLLLPASVSITPVTAQGAQVQPVAANAISIITLTNESAGVRRLGWSTFTRLILGSQVAFGDLIDPKGQIVRVLCANLVEIAVTSLGPIPCPRSRPVLMQDNQILAGWQRGKAEDVTIPFLISPRGSDVVTTHPTLWWNSVDGADSYRVTVRGDGLQWTKVVTDPKVSQIVYPKDAPALKPGETYNVEITAITNGADTHSSTEEDVPGLSFTVMEADKVAPIAQAASTIKATVADKNVANMTIALLYAQNGLDADAVQLLTGITGDLMAPAKTTTNAQLSASPAVYLKLGDLFLQSHSEIYASAAYNRALDLATQSSDIESQAQAQVGLARLASDPDKQTEYATNALKLWQQLGATDQAAAVQKEFSLTVN